MCLKLRKYPVLYCSISEDEMIFLPFVVVLLKVQSVVVQNRPEIVRFGYGKRADPVTGHGSYEYEPAQNCL